MKRLGPSLARRLDLEGQFAMGAEGAAGKGVISRVEIGRRGRVGRAQIMRGEEQSRRAPASERPEPACRPDHLPTGAPRRAPDRGVSQSPTLGPGAQIPLTLRFRARTSRRADLSETARSPARIPYAVIA